jgi:hypothetical protein
LGICQQEADQRRSVRNSDHPDGLRLTNRNRRDREGNGRGNDGGSAPRKQLKDAVTSTNRGEGMALEVLSAQDHPGKTGDNATAILKVAVHTEGFPDGFGDAPATTRCYEMTFNATGLTDTPEDICPRNPWPDN